MPRNIRLPEWFAGEPCASCWGYGRVLVRDPQGRMVASRVPCVVCGGSGLVGGGSTDAGPREVTRG